MIKLCILPVVSALLFSQADPNEKRQTSSNDGAPNLQVDIFCGEMRTATDFRFTIDDRSAGKIDVKFKGRLPCLGRFNTPVEPGAHTLRVESKKLKTSGSLPIVIRPGQNWVVVNPRNESQGDRSGWSLFMEQPKNQPRYQ